jgi:phage-related minor tail protein
MAEDIRVKFTGDSSSYKKELQALVAQNKMFESELKRVESTFNDSMTTEEKAAKKKQVLNKQVKAQEEYVNALQDQMNKLTFEQKENTAEGLKQEDALNKANTALNKMKKELADAEKAADGYGEETEEASKHTETMDQAAKLLAAEKLADFFNKAGEAAAKLAKASYDAAKELDEGYDTIIKKTGASGKELEDLQGVADDVFGSMPVEMSDVGTAVGELNTRFKLTGDELKSTSKTFLQFSKITDTDVNSAVASTSKILKAYGKDVKDADALLGYLAKQSQDTGIETGQLMSSLEQNGATLREMGIGLQESVKLLASFEENGVDASAAMTGLRKAIVNGAKEGKSANTVLTETISRIKNAKSDTEALQIATEVFGTRGAAVMADGIRTGRIALDNLSESMDQYGTVVADTFEATLDPWDQAKIAMNNLKTAGSNLAGEALAVLAPAIEKVVGWVQQATTWFKNLPAPVQKVVAVVGALGAGAAVVGPKIMSVVNTIKSLQASTSILKGFKGAADGVAESGGKIGSGFGRTAGIVGGVTVAMMALNSALVEASLAGNELYQAAKKDAAAMKDLQRQSAALVDEVEDLHAKQAAEEKQIADLSSELIDLNKKTKLTKDEQARYKQVVGQLSNLLPGFSSEIDESTGKLKDQKQASTQAINALADNKRALNATDNLTGALDRQAEAFAQQTQAEQTAKEWADRFGVSMEDLKTKTEGVSNSSSGIGALFAKLSGNTSYTFMNQLADAAIQTGQAMRDADEAVKLTTEDVDLYSGAAGDAATATDGANGTVDEFGDALEEAGDSAVDTADAVEVSFQDILDAANSDLMGSLNVIEQWADDGGASLNDFKAIMQKNAKDWTSYTNNVRSLTSDMRYNTDANFRGMVDMLIAQGGKGATAVSQLANAVKTGDTSTVSSFQDMYVRSNSAMNNFVGAVGYLNAQTQAKTKGIPGYAQTAATGFSSAFTNAQGTVRSSATNLGNVAVNGLNIAGKTGAYGANAVSNYASGISGAKGKASGAASGVASVTSAMDNAKFYSMSWGAELVTRFAKGMNQAKWRVTAASKAIANAAKSYIHFTLPDEGPLRQIGKWGPEMVEQYTAGIKKALPMVEAASAQIAYAAMPSVQMPGATTTNNSLTYGDIVVNVNGAGVQNDAQLARMVSQEIFKQVRAERAVWA